MIDSGECQHTCSSTYPKCEDGKFWQSRYRAEEDGAAKQKITADELENLVFDFRFWMGEPTILGDEQIKFKSGLVDSASREFRFLRNARERQERWSAEGPFWNAKGHVLGIRARKPESNVSSNHQFDGYLAFYSFLFITNI